jgi:hypothetical protein
MKLPHTGRLMLTHADFPQQDWESWRRKEIDESRDDDGATIDTSYLNVMPCCIHCATWICVGCYDFRRSRATRAVSQYCPRCGGIKGFFVAIRHLKPHERLKEVPFIVPRMTPDNREARMKSFEEAVREPLKRLGEIAGAISRGCPAGDPCPGTGCPACCPSYDPCGEKGCENCQASRKRENMERVELSAARERTVISNIAEREFWGLHKFQEAQDSICCSRCGWGYNDPIHTKEIKVHVPEEAALAKENAMGIDAPQDIPGGEASLPPGDYTVPPDSVLGKQIRAEMAKRGGIKFDPVEESPTPEYPYTEGDIVVLGPGISVNPGKDVIHWEGRNFYPYDETPVRKVTDKDRELIAANSRATIERRDRTKLKNVALQWALDALKQNGAIPGGSNPEFLADSLVKAADKILNWLTEDTI